MDLFHTQDLSYPGNKWFDHFGLDDVVLYGEGYGAKIQKGGGNYISSGVDFILFDVKVGDWWLKRDAVDDIANLFGIKSVPGRAYASITDVIEIYKAGGLISYVAETPGTIAEGLVRTPAVSLFARNGDRIITKIKTRDFAGVK